ncbi:MAG TPA: NrfD/PsrC family molybdoenzyme membrane anchor subunit [Thermomicrobiales bacterium]|jgi:formate-dependent nitrite reductase membrane component NrfD
MRLTPLVAITGQVADPHWYWWIIAYFFLGGIAAGAFLIAATVDLFADKENRPVTRVGYLIAAPLAALCGLLLALDLGKPLRFWHMLVNVTTMQPAFKYWSPMSYGSWILTGFGLCSGLAFLTVLGEWRGFGWAAVVGKIAGALGLAFAILLVSYTGVLLNVTNQRVWGDNTLLGALFAASGVSTGIATIALILGVRRGQNPVVIERLERADLLTILIEIGLLLALVVALINARAGAVLYAGKLAPIFWGGVLVVGLLFPLGLYLRPRLLGHSTVIVASTLALVGGFILRAVILFSAHA